MKDNPMANIAVCLALLIVGFTVADYAREHYKVPCSCRYQDKECTPDYKCSKTCTCVKAK